MSELEKRARELLDAATPGPWEVCPMNVYIYGSDGNMVADEARDRDDAPANAVARIRGHGAEISGQRPEGSQDANLALIAAAPELLREMLGRIAGLEKYVGEYLTAIGACDDSDDDSEESLCESPSCTYCQMARALQPECHGPPIAAGTDCPECGSEGFRMWEARPLFACSKCLTTFFGDEPEQAAPSTGGE